MLPELKQSAEPTIRGKRKIEKKTDSIENFYAQFIYNKDENLQRKTNGANDHKSRTTIANSRTF